MVTFECECCIRALKKKQIETHYKFECRNANNFCCLTCYKFFDRETVVGHTSCVTEQEKYQKGDNTVKKGVQAAKVMTVVKVNIEELKWSGFRKTSKKILLGQEGFKLPMKDIFDKLAHVYAKNKGVDKSEVCCDLVKKHTLNKMENDDRFVIDLSKNTIRYKF